MKSRTSLKTSKIGSLFLEIHPVIAEKASHWLCNQHNSFIFDLIFIKLAVKLYMNESDKFENWPDWIINLKSFSHLIAGKKPLFDCLTHSVLIGCS